MKHLNAVKNSNHNVLTKQKLPPAWVDKEHPKFADVCQKALNSSNNVASMVAEIEIAKVVADMMQDCDENWKDRAIEAVVAQGAACAPYCTFIIDFVEKYAGGEGAPLLDFIDSVAKQFQCTAVLGQTFWKAIAEASFSTKESTMPLVRVALILANLASPKLEDGIARLVLKSDIQRLQVKQKLSDVLDADKKLKQAMEVAASVAKTKKLQADAQNGPLGRFFVRVVVHLIGKEKDSAEGTEYKSINDICAAYLGELSNMLGGTVTYKHWTGVKAEPVQQAAEGPPAKKHCTAIGLEQQTDKVYRANTEGFVTGAIVYERAIGPGPTNLWRLTEVNESFAKLKLVCDYKKEDATVVVELDPLLQEWSISKIASESMPYQMVGDYAHEHRADTLGMERVKATVFMGLLSLNEERGCKKDDILFYRKPDHLRAAKEFSPGQLILTPFGAISALSTKEVSSGVFLGNHSVHGESSDFWLLPPPKPAKHPTDSKSSLCPFFWVDGTPDAKLVNMKESMYNHGGMKLPIMKNTKTLKVNDKLYKLKEAKEAAVPLSNIMTISSAAASSTSSASKPKTAAKSKIAAKK